MSTDEVFSELNQIFTAFYELQITFSVNESNDWGCLPGGGGMPHEDPNHAKNIASVAGNDSLSGVSQCRTYEPMDVPDCIHLHQ